MKRNIGTILLIGFLPAMTAQASAYQINLTSTFSDFNPALIGEYGTVTTTLSGASSEFLGAAVPIPGAAWVPGGGLIGLVVIRRKNNK